MFRRVLVATDFSGYADSMLDCIGQIPGMEEILLVHVTNGSPPARDFSRSSPPPGSGPPSLRKNGGSRTDDGRPVSTRVAEAEEGDISGAIIRLAQGEYTAHRDGRERKGLLSGFILGSVSEGVIRRSNTDVLIMHFRAGDPGEARLEKFCRNVFSHVLCPVDFSKPSEKTLEYAKSLGIIRHITLLHVMNGKGSGPEQGETYRGIAGKNLPGSKRTLPGPGIRAKPSSAPAVPPGKLSGQRGNLMCP